MGGNSMSGMEARMQQIEGTPKTYFGSVGKIFNTWREHAVNVHDIWKAKYGPGESEQHAATMPPKCIKGIWGSTYECERKLLSMPRNHFAR
eukprot:543925-Pyramimonas_sp.AAC.1